MMSIHRPVPSGQSRAFNLAVVERLGINPGITLASGVGFETVDERYTRVTVSVILPTDEVLHMFNTGEAPRR